MGIACKRRITVVVLALLGLVAFSRLGWGQERIGTVIVVENVAEARAQDATEWERLRFRDAIFLNDTVRTAAESKVKLLLRDDSIITLGQQSEMEFTEFVLTADQRRTIMALVIGKLRLITTKIFGAGSVTEVHTANAVAGVRGTDMIVTFTPPALTDVLVRATEAEVTVRNPNLPQVEAVLPNSRTQVVGNTAPAPATALPEQAWQEALREVSTPASQVPEETQTTDELRQDPLPDTPRGGETPPPEAGRETGAEPDPVIDRDEPPTPDPTGKTEEIISDASESPELQETIQATNVGITIRIPR